MYFTNRQFSFAQYSERETCPLCRNPLQLPIILQFELQVSCSAIACNVLGPEQNFFALDCGHVFHAKCLPTATFGPILPMYGFKECPVCHIMSTRLIQIFNV